MRVLLLLALVTACGHRPPERGPMYVPRVRAPEEARQAFVRGRVAELRGDLGEAERSLRWMLATDPDDPWAWMAWARFLQRQLRDDAAERAWVETLARDPDLIEARLAIAHLYLDRGDDAAGRTHLERAVALGEVQEAPFVLALRLVLGGDVDAATGVWEAWRSVDTGLPPATRLKRGRLALVLDRPAAAVEDLAAGLVREVGPAALGASMVEAAQVGCRLGTAWEWGQREQLDRDPAWRDVATRLARATGDERALDDLLGPGAEVDAVRTVVGALERAGRLDRALVRAREGRVVFGTDDGLRLDEARVLIGLGHVGPGLVGLERIEVTAPHGPAALQLAVTWLGRTGRHEEALAVSAAGLAARPTEPTVVWARALALVDSGTPDPAEALVASVEAWDAAERRRRIGLLRARVGRDEAAVAALQEAVEAGSARARWDLVTVRTRAGDDAGAVEALDAIVRADPSDQQAVTELVRRRPERSAALAAALPADVCDATVLLELGRATRDVDLLRRAWEASPVDPEVLGAYGAALIEAGDADRGRQLIERATGRRPTSGAP